VSRRHQHLTPTQWRDATLDLSFAQLAAWREHARESILQINDGIASAAGVAEGFATAGATVHTLLLAGLTLIVAGALAAAGARYSEVRTEWEMNRSLIEEERASLRADPEGEMEELVGIYQAKGLEPQLARQVAEALSSRDAVAAHVDAELGLDRLGTSSGAVLAAAIAGLSYGLGAAVPLLLVYFLPLRERVASTLVVVLLALALTGSIAARMTGLPTLRLVRRNVMLGATTMAAAIVVGYAVHI
jgi:vacuolar iron transporter family protein